MQQSGTAVGAIYSLLALVILMTPATISYAGNGRAQDALVCDEAIGFAAREFGVPETVLKAVARTESGITVNGSFIAWPWTVNIEGRGQRFPSRSEALEFFKKSYAKGARNIDLGCFQVNHRWHGDRFEAVGDMLIPTLNARYAAKFLKELYVEFGNWTVAVGAFHSRTSEFSEKYLARYTPILRNLTGVGKKYEQPYRIVQKENQFPLLKGTSQSGANGSLFPLATGSGPGLLSALGRRG